MHLNSPCVGLFLSLQAYIFVFRYVFKNVFLYPFIVSVKVGFLGFFCGHVCVNTRILENSFSASIPVEELAK